MIKISLVLSIWNQLKIIKNCFDSLHRNWSDEYELIVVDDCSNSETRKYLISQCERFFPNYKYIQNNKRLYFTGSCINGVNHCSKDAKFLLFMNSDVIITKQTIPLLLETFDFDDKIAVAGPSTSQTSSEQKDYYAYQKRFEWWNNYDAIQQYADQLQNKYKNDYQEIDLVGGFCMAIRKDTYDKIPFDSDFVDYGGEKYHQICLRNKGYKTVWRKGAFALHFAKASYSQTKFNIGIRQKEADKLIYKKLQDK